LLARHKFRLELFEKRYKVYDVTANFPAAIVKRANFTEEELCTCIIGTRDAVFLYPKDIKDYLHEIRRRALEMRLLQTRFTTLPVGEERSKLVQMQIDEITWLSDQLTKLPDIFTPFLGFASVK
jgi:hypothetical protein